MEITAVELGVILFGWSVVTILVFVIIREFIIYTAEETVRREIERRRNV